MDLYCNVCKAKTDHRQHSKLFKEGTEWKVRMVCQLCGNIKKCGFCHEDFEGTKEQEGKGVITMRT